MFRLLTFARNLRGIFFYRDTHDTTRWSTRRVSRWEDAYHVKKQKSQTKRTWTFGVWWRFFLCLHLSLSLSSFSRAHEVVIHFNPEGIIHYALCAQVEVLFLKALGFVLLCPTCSIIGFVRAEHRSFNLFSSIGKFKPIWSTVHVAPFSLSRYRAPRVVSSTIFDPCCTHW